ncbi:unnamed protein product [Spirodela intermedia]|uniref:Uncharacterized protein n=1 Tax=Spirodela intermedia TaxID=51605 RepID=A0A7I8IG48_SPIIN|nr:unnamed protein product [Spirodela intermedia]CAA6656053.1 unnamed protein product [Spirodela intermedia]
MGSSSDSALCTDPDLLVSHRFRRFTVFTYNERDVVLYALGIGACGGDAVDDKELKYVYHGDGQHHVKVLPTFVTIFPFHSEGIKGMPDLQFDPSLMLHGQQYIEIYKTLPTNSRIQNKQAIAGLHDKGKAAIIELETSSYEQESGEVLCMNRSTLYFRGAGGFSKSSQPYSYSNYPQSQVSAVRIPKSKPAAIYEDYTKQNQALLYRLSGDHNPLHSDPMVAEIAGFDRPILHGLCSLGFAVRAVIKSFCNGEPSSVKAVFGRFLLHVYPGETLITEMWLDGSRNEDGRCSNGYVALRHIPSSL